MKVAAHPLVVAVAMGLLGPGALAEVLDTESPRDPATRGPAPSGTPTCADCGENDEDESGELVAFAPESGDRDVEAWMARPTPTVEAQTRALAEYLASTQA